ncbi:MAG: hypothetical protein PHU06_09295 [Gallionella sp.]|nr:hypothetical protein [Gallionella sp.]MDD4959827.1 hypothetical protein [Gallionella sp.]
MSTIYTHVVIPAQAGIQQETPCCEADKTMMLSRRAGTFSINWIPACAGMTEL